MTPYVFYFLPILWGFIPAVIARSKGYNIAIFYVFGVFVLPWALTVSLGMKSRIPGNMGIHIPSNNYWGD